MLGVDRKALNEATIVSYALVMGLLEELDDSSRKRVISRALDHLPPQPDHLEAPPADRAMWFGAKAFLQTLGAK